MHISHDELLRTLSYDPSTGLFRWRRSGSNSKKGSIAGGIAKGGYVQIHLSFGHTIRLHRLAWFYIYGSWPEGQIDHINHVRTDNRIANLRVVDNTENQRNRTIPRNNTTGVQGVSVCKRNGKYISTITICNKQISLGHYLTIEDAALARSIANVRYGFHDNHGKQRRELVSVECKS